MWVCGISPPRSHLTLPNCHRSASRGCGPTSVDERDAAGELQPTDVCSLEAIHLTTADQLGRDLARLVTYDDRMLEAAKILNIRTHVPR